MQHIHKFQELRGRYLWGGHYSAYHGFISLTLLLAVNTLLCKVVLPSFSSTGSARIGQLPYQHLVLSDLLFLLLLSIKDSVFSLLVMWIIFFHFYTTHLHNQSLLML